MTLAQTYRYAELSTLNVDGRPQLTLATSGGAETANPYFFTGDIKYPQQTARLLTSLHVVVTSRFFTPPNTVAKLIALSDPVVTCGGGFLRFEGFSTCCSAYARVDLLPESYAGEIVSKGSTNVDFNASMRAALARVRDDAGLRIDVGRSEFQVRSGDAAAIERKVDLPERWLRGMLEAQSYLASMRLRFEANGVEALRLLRSLPRGSTARTPLWIGRSPAGLVASTQPIANGVRVADTGRLKILETLAPQALSLAVYSDEQQQSTAWVLHFLGARFTLALSAEVWRGFSGEGQALRALMKDDAEMETKLPMLRAKLAWQSGLDPVSLASELNCSESLIADGLRILGVSGWVGYDLTAGAYFHRVLPLDLSSVEDMHPRLKGARQLLADDAVRLRTGAPLTATVSSNSVEHTVREVEGELRCTCPWFAKHQGQRGPCKHVLAVEAMQVRSRAS